MAAERDRRDVRWDDHRSRKRQELVAATIRTVQAHGADVTMEQIAETAGTGKATLYRYFGDRSGLHQAVTDHVNAIIIAKAKKAAATGRNPTEAVRAMIGSYVRLIEADPQLYVFVEYRTIVDIAIASDPSADTVDDLAELISTVLPGLPGTREVQLITATGLVTMLRASVGKWLISPIGKQPSSRTALIEALTTVIISGCAG